MCFFKVVITVGSHPSKSSRMSVERTDERSTVELVVRLVWLAPAALSALLLSPPLSLYQRSLSALRLAYLQPKAKAYTYLFDLDYQKSENKMQSCGKFQANTTHYHLALHSGILWTMNAVCSYIRLPFVNSNKWKIRKLINKVAISSESQYFCRLHISKGRKKCELERERNRVWVLESVCLCMCVCRGKRASP